MASLDTYTVLYAYSKLYKASKQILLSVNLKSHIALMVSKSGKAFSTSTPSPTSSSLSVKISTVIFRRTFRIRFSGVFSPTGEVTGEGELIDEPGSFASCTGDKGVPATRLLLEVVPIEPILCEDGLLLPIPDPDSKDLSKSSNPDS